MTEPRGIICLLGHHFRPTRLWEAMQGQSTTWLPFDTSHLVPHVTNHITSPLCPTGTGIPVHGTLRYEHTTRRLHRHRDLVTPEGITWLDQVLAHQRPHIDGEARMRSHRILLGSIMAIAIDKDDRNRFTAGRRVLHCQPLVIALVAVPLGKTIGRQPGRPRLPRDIAAPLRQDRPTRQPVEVVVLEEHLALSRNGPTTHRDLRRDTLGEHTGHGSTRALLGGRGI